MQGSEKPRLLLVSPAKQHYFDQMFAGLLSTLADNFQVSEALNLASTQLGIAEGHPAAILVTDEFVCKKNQGGLRTQLDQYVENGGTVVFGGSFSGRTSQQDFDRTFKAFPSLEWSRGDYFRSTFALSRDSLLRDMPGLAPSYSMKALHVKVPTMAHAVYKATEESHVESLVFAPTPVDTSSGEAPAAFARFGQGYVGYIGDVNAEEASSVLTAAMCLYPRGSPMDDAAQQRALQLLRRFTGPGG